MKLTFRHIKLGKIANNEKRLFTEFNTVLAKKFKQRLDDMISASSLEDLRYAPGHYRALTGDKKDLFACDLDHPFSLIFTTHENSTPAKGRDVSSWHEITAIEIVGLSDTIANET